MRIQIQTGHSSDDMMAFEIKDEVSRETIARFRLSPSQVYALMAGRTLYAEAAMTNHPERIGQRMINTSAVYTRREIVGPDATAYGDTLLGLALAKAKADPQYAGFETFEPHLTNNGGVTVVMRRWIEDTRCGARDGEDVCDRDAGHDGNHRSLFAEWGA